MQNPMVYVRLVVQAMVPWHCRLVAIHPSTAAVEHNPTTILSDKELRVESSCQLTGLKPPFQALFFALPPMEVEEVSGNL